MGWLLGNVQLEYSPERKPLPQLSRKGNGGKMGISDTPYSWLAVEY